MKPQECGHKLVWISLNAILLCLAVIELVNLRGNFLEHPTVTSLVSSSYPVRKVPFPAVSICSVNKISKKRAQELAFEITNVSNVSYGTVLENLHFIGQLYDFDLDHRSVTQIAEFQRILEKLNMEVVEIIQKITVPCDELLDECYWGNDKVDCSNIFFMRLTYEGYCCVFNYIKELPDLGNQKIEDKPITAEAGVENGLFVAVRNNVEDYFYTTLSFVGLIVHIFLPNEYPDKTTGGLTEILATPNSENFIEIDPTTQISAPEVAYYPVEKRNCLFHGERQTIMGIYSLSDCFLDCKLASIRAMCQCVPFFIPVHSDDSVCTLADLSCLNSHKAKWNSYSPEGDFSTFLSREMHNSLRCKDACHPPCTETVYGVTINSFPVFNKSATKDNLTRINVYYRHRFSRLYRLDVVYYWFDFLSNYGGILGIFLGWSLIFMIHSLISITKGIFFIIKKIMKNIQ